MNHSFDVDLATKYGILEAILLDNINYWLLKNEANKKNYFDGNYWTYNSTRAFSELFPYASQKKIQTALKKLIKEGLIVTGNYNKNAYDRTLWYALTEKGKYITRKGKMEFRKKENEFTENVQPIPITIPNTIPDTIPDIKKEIYKEKKTKRFVKPSIEEIKEYVFENSLNVDCEYFYDYYESNGWTVGKNHMKDWKATLRNWSRRKSTVKKKSQIEEILEIGEMLDEQERSEQSSSHN